MPTNKASTKRKRSNEPIVIDEKVYPYTRLFPKEVNLSEEEVGIIIEILSIFDNRHDFKPGSRNQSLTLNEVLVLLSDKSELIHRKIIESTSNNKLLLQELLNIHCKALFIHYKTAMAARYTRGTCNTIDNPDYRVEDYMINTVFQEPIVIERKSHLGDGNKYKRYEISNMQKLKFSSKESLEAACGLGSDSNPFLEDLLEKLATLMGTDSQNIRFCIDVSSIGEWVFHHNASRTADTHLKTIADDYDCFRINPERKKLVQPFTLKENHIALTDFTVQSDTIKWRSPNRDGELSLERTTRAGVAIMAEAIRIVLDSKKSKSKKKRSDEAAPELIETIFGLSYKTDIDSITYGKHIMDFKRLMDTTKLAVTMLYNMQQRGPKVILVTHDHMLYLLAKTLQCPVILTIKNVDHSRELLFDIPITLTKEEQERIKAERIIQQQEEQRRKEAARVVLTRLSQTMKKPPTMNTTIYSTNTGSVLYKYEQTRATLLGGTVRIHQTLTKTINKYLKESVTAENFTQLENEITSYNILVNEISRFQSEEQNLQFGNIRGTEAIITKKQGLFVSMLDTILEKLTNKDTKAYELVNGVKTNLSKKGGVTIHEDKIIIHSALDLLIKFIRKFIARYESQSRTEQEKYYQYQEQDPRFPIVTRPMLEALMAKFVEMDKPSRGLTQEPAKVRITNRRIVSAPAALVPPKAPILPSVKMVQSITGKRKASKTPSQLLAELVEE